VVARSLSLEVAKLDLKLCHTHRRDDPIAYWGQAIVAVSGPAAEQKFAAYPLEVQARLWKSYWKTDRANADYWLGLIHGVSLAQAEAMARHLVGEHWPAIVRVAEALAEEGELSGVALDRLWRE
jgi:hypothetical protein